MDNPGQSMSRGTVYHRLVNLFYRTWQRGEVQAHYDGSEKIDGFRVLHTERERNLLAVYRHRDTTWYLLENVSYVPFKSRNITWKTVEDDTKTNRSGMPEGFPALPKRVFISKAEKLPSFPGTDKDQIQNGIYRKQNSTETKLYKKGNYRDVLGTPDRSWIIAQRKRKKKVVLERIRVDTKEAFRVEHPELTDRHVPFTFIPGTGNVLLSPASDDEKNGTSSADLPHLSLDPESGTIEVVEGTVRPLTQLRRLSHSGSHSSRERPLRSFQEADAKNEYWVAMAKKGETTSPRTIIGRYNVETLSFEKIMMVPGLTFNSLSMWVDETKGTVYVANHPDVIKFDLKSNSKK